MRGELTVDWADGGEPGSQKLEGLLVDLLDKICFEEMAEMAEWQSLIGFEEEAMVGQGCF